MTEEPKGRRIESRTEIAAPAARVWTLVSDLDGWSRWNPLCPKAAGTLAVGETLDLTIVLPGLKPQQAHPVIVGVTPGESIRYATVQAGGLMRAHRYIVVTPQGEAGCVVRNGEIFAGLLGRIVSALLSGKILLGLVLMNTALKKEAERPSS